MNLLTQEDFEKGLKSYNEAIALDPTDPLPYIGLALVTAMQVMFLQLLLMLPIDL